MIVARVSLRMRELVGRSCRIFHHRYYSLHFIHWTSRVLYIQNAIERQRKRLFSRLLCQDSARRMLRVKQRRQKRIRQIRWRFDGIRRQQSAKKMLIMFAILFYSARISPERNCRTLPRYRKIMEHVQQY